MISKLDRLIDISKITIEIASKTIPLIIQIPFHTIPPHKIDTLKHFANKMLSLTDNIIFTDEISLDNLAQNIYDFLNYTRNCLFLISTHSTSFNEKQIDQIQERIEKLIMELNSPPFLQHQRGIRRFFTDKKPDDNFTEPQKRFC